MQSSYFWWSLGYTQNLLLSLMPPHAATRKPVFCKLYLRHCNNEILLHCSRFSLFCILIKIFGNSTCALHTRLVELFTHASCPVAVVGRGLFESSPWRLLWCTFHLWHRMLNQWPLIWFHPAELLLSTVEFLQLLRWLSIWECPLLIQKGMYSRRS